MNYDRVIIELLDRISILEEKTEQLEKIVTQHSVLGIGGNKMSERKTRDKTKYILDGRTCLKNRLVLEVVNKYIAEHPWVTFDALRDVFYDKLQGTFGVVRKMNEVPAEKEVRYFMKDKIELTDGTEVVVSNQWGKDNIKAFVLLAKSLGYEIQAI